jgi:hypothetical protein
MVDLLGWWRLTDLSPAPDRPDTGLDGVGRLSFRRPPEQGDLDDGDGDDEDAEENEAVHGSVLSGEDAAERGDADHADGDEGNERDEVHNQMPFRNAVVAPPGIGTMRVKDEGEKE